MEPFSVESWLASEDEDVWTGMMKRVAAFHHKHDFAGNNGHDMGYRIALTVEELGELAAAITKNKPIEEVAEEMADVLILLMGHSLAMNIFNHISTLLVDICTTDDPTFITILVGCQLDSFLYRIDDFSIIKHILLVASNNDVDAINKWSIHFRNGFPCCSSHQDCTAALTHR